MATEADIETFQAFRVYDFDNDEKFQSGMASILKRAEDDPSSQNDVVERAKWFYYTKFIKSFDLDEYRGWNSNDDTGSSSDKKDGIAATATETEESKETNDSRDSESEKKEDGDKPPRFTFQELVEMIETGQEIPGIRQIPNKINEGTPSEPKLSVRRKPWESAAAATPAAGEEAQQPQVATPATAAAPSSSSG
ncbi:hypothetical protein BDB00DRAFT_236117 [Zychaea mexicana]|uniref:uncharacterized protein n=1 Tax=Zychaea mexicana TaxID=64656 RepID=UPI0022FE62A6|nr:uncharacterized protein BDB00DRAFT_236117 [Zychaea mexicana]KAI9495507.1 hypothetical protein BDB00DRAFT_236117 [Zychaea mexicana]